MITTLQVIGRNKDQMTERVKKIPINPFGYNLNLIVTSDVKASFEKRRKRLGTTAQLSPTVIAFTFTKESSCDIYVFYPEQAGVGTVVHELLHVVAFVMRRVGADFEEENWAYQLDHLSQVVSEFIWKPYIWNIKTRKKA